MDEEEILSTGLLVSKLMGPNGASAVRRAPCLKELSLKLLIDRRPLTSFDGSKHDLLP